MDLGITVATAADSWKIVKRAEGRRMIRRRTFLALLATTAVVPDVSWAQVGAGRVALYESVGPTLTHYEVDVPGAALTRRSMVTLPAPVQYAWPHVSRQYLYVASSNSALGLGGVVGDQHHVSALMSPVH
jgi:hypothetical protein